MKFFYNIFGQLECPCCGFILKDHDEYYEHILNCPKCGEKIDKEEPKNEKDIL